MPMGDPFCNACNSWAVNCRCGDIARTTITETFTPISDSNLRDLPEFRMLKTCVEGIADQIIDEAEYPSPSGDRITSLANFIKNALNAC